ncbi:hypothetical protein Esti_004955 [Eimeria stiedai]
MGGSASFTHTGGVPPLRVWGPSPRCIWGWATAGPLIGFLCFSLAVSASPASEADGEDPFAGMFDLVFNGSEGGSQRRSIETLQDSTSREVYVQPHSYVDWMSEVQKVEDADPDESKASSSTAAAAGRKKRHAANTAALPSKKKQQQLKAEGDDDFFDFSADADDEADAAPAAAAPAAAAPAAAAAVAGGEKKVRRTKAAAASNKQRRGKDAAAPNSSNISSSSSSSGGVDDGSVAAASRRLVKKRREATAAANRGEKEGKEQEDEDTLSPSSSSSLDSLDDLLSEDSTSASSEGEEKSTKAAGRKRRKRAATTAAANPLNSESNEGGSNASSPSSSQKPKKKKKSSGRDANASVSASTPEGSGDGSEFEGLENLFGSDSASSDAQQELAGGSHEGGGEAAAEGEGRDSSPLTLSVKANERESSKTTRREGLGGEEAQLTTPLAPVKDPELAFKESQELAARREARRMKALELQQKETSVQSLYNRAQTVSPSFNYVGIGYDSVRGNPLGDPNLMGDPGLRSPIIRFKFVQDEEGVTSDLTELQPLGAYSRPYVACKQSENLSEVATISDYVRELEADAQLAGGDALGLYSFSASAFYKDVARKALKRNSKTFLLKTYCLRYEAGLAQTESFNWNYTLAFTDASDHLPSTFEGTNSTEGCTPTKWRENSHVEECAKTNVHQWFDFIEQFGTHYIVRLFAGGKLTHQITMANSDLASLNSSGVSVKAAIKATFSVISSNGSADVEHALEQREQLKSYNYETETLIMGGRVPKDVSDADSMAEWSDSVEELPMPVKITLQPISNLLPFEKRDAFEAASRFYAESVGMSKADLTAMGGKVETIGEILRAGTQVMYAGEPPGFAMCPEHERIILGFGIQLNFLDDTGIQERAAIKACMPGRDKCDGLDGPPKEGDDARLFVVCGREPVSGLEQVVSQSRTRASATCPEGYVIAVGFALSLTGGRAGPASTTFFPCRAGLTTCSSMGSKKTQRNFVWIACVDEKTPGLQNIVNTAKTFNATATKQTNGDGQVTVSCPKPLGVALGFAMELHTRFNKVREKFEECHDNAASCSLTGKGISEAFFYRTKDTHALLAFVSCAEVPNSSPQTTSIEHQEVEGSMLLDGIFT